jgi:hypothetical protein
MPIVAASIGAGGAVLGGAAAGGLFGGSKVKKVRPGDVRASATKSKNQLLFGKTISTGPNKGVSVPGLDISSGLSGVNAGTGEVNIDPSGRALKIGALEQFNTNLGETRSSLLGNKGAFSDARVNPLVESLAKGRGALSRDLSRTGVRGTFRDRSLQDFDIAGNRAVGDQRALAEQESLSAINTIDQLSFNATSGTGTDIFNEELKALGFGLDTINVINSLANNLAVGSGNIANSSAATSAISSQARSENITGLLGAGLSAFGSSPSSPSPPPAAPIQEGL